MRFKWIALVAVAVAVAVCLIVKAAVPIAEPTLYNFDRRDFIIDDSIVPAVVSNIIRTVLEAHAPSTPGDQYYLTINNTNISLLAGFFNPTVGFLPVRGATNWLDSPVSADVANGSLIVGSTGSAVNRSTNYIYLPITAGTPVGTPATEGTHMAMVYDSVNDLLYAWNPATSWHIIGTNIFYLTGAVINPTDWKVPYRVNATTFGDTGMHPTNVNDMVFDGRIDAVDIEGHSSLIAGGMFQLAQSSATPLVVGGPNNIDISNLGFVLLTADLNGTDPTLRTISLNDGHPGQIIILENTTNVFAGVTQSAFSLTNNTPEWDDGSKLIFLRNGDWKPTAPGEAIWMFYDGFQWTEIMRVIDSRGGTAVGTNPTTPFVPYNQNGTFLDAPIFKTNTLDMVFQGSIQSDGSIITTNANFVAVKDGTVGSPDFAFESPTSGYGFFRDAAGNPSVAVASANVIRFATGGPEIPNNAGYLWAVGAPDVTVVLVGIYNHAGNPNGSLSANVGSLSLDTTAGITWAKTNGSGNTGWTQLAGGGGGASVNPTSGVYPVNSSGAFVDGLWYAAGTKSVGFRDATPFITRGGTFETGIGENALALQTAGLNTAVGYGAMSSSTNASGSVAIGYNAAPNQQSNNSVIVGKSAGLNGSTISQSVLIGQGAASSVTNLTEDIIIGNQALGTSLRSAVNGTIAIGPNSLFNVTANNNIAIGGQAGTNIITGFNNVVIGDSADVLNSADKNSVVIGFGAKGHGTNTVTLGSTNVNDLWVGTNHVSLTGTGGGGNMTNSGPSVAGMIPTYTDTSGTQVTPTNGVPSLEAGTLNVTGTMQVAITNQVLVTDGGGAVTGGSSVPWYFGVVKTCSAVTIVLTNYIEVVINGTTNAIPIVTVTP